MIMEHLKSIDELKGIVETIDCINLESREKVNRPMTFVSFKVDIPRQYYDIIADPEIWHFEGEDKLTVEKFS